NLTPYESQPGVAGQQESYAESTARHFRGDPDANTRYPHLGEYWASQWGLAWNLNTSERHTWTLPATSPSTCGRSTKAELSALLGSSTRPVILSTTTYSVTSAASCQASKNSSLLGRTNHPEPLLAPPVPSRPRVPRAPLPPAPLRPHPDVATEDLLPGARIRWAPPGCPSA